MIHPQAIIDPSAKIGRDVTVGAFSVIGADVEIGDETWIGPHVVINGPTRIGRGNRIYQFSSLGDAPQHIGYKGEPTRLEVGDRNTIREYCTFNRGTPVGVGVTRIGDDNFFMAYSHVAHDCSVGNRTIFANGSTLGGHVVVEDYAIFGGFTMVHQHCRVGAHCITAGGSACNKDIPPYFVAAGNFAQPHGINIRGLKRRDFPPAVIENIRRAYKLIYLSDLRLEQALERLAELDDPRGEIGHLAGFIRSSERGIIR